MTNPDFQKIAAAWAATAQSLAAANAQLQAELNLVRSQLAAAQESTPKTPDTSAPA